MKFGILGSLAVAAAFAGSVATAAPVTVDINLIADPTSDIGGFATPVGTAQLTFDTTTAGWGIGVGSARRDLLPAFDQAFAGDFDFTIDIFGVAPSFFDDDDTDASMAVDIFGSGNATYFSFALTGLSVPVTGGTVTGIASVGAPPAANLTFLSAGTGGSNDLYSLEVLISGTAAPTTVVPLPAPFLLLGAGLAGLGLRSKLRKKTA